MNDHIAREQKQQRQSDSDQSRTQSNDNGFCIKYLRYISLRCPDRAQDSNLLLPFQYTDVGDNPDHN